MAVDYRARLKRVYAAIHDDPARDQSFDDLADLAALSRLHFHRAFAAMTGETLAEAVRRIRLNGAAHTLVQGRAPVAVVGRAHGYPVAASFARAFRAAYGMTHAQFRARGQALPAALRRKQGGGAMFPVWISNEVPRRVIGLPHRGAYTGLSAAYDWLLGVWLADAGEVLRDAPSWELYVNDPMDTAPEDLRTDIYLPLEDAP